MVNREDGKLVFKLPVTTLLNHDVPITPEGVRVCPVAGVQWNGAAYSPADRIAIRERDRLVHRVQAGPEPEVGGDRALSPGSPTAGAPTTRSSKWYGMDQRGRSEERKDGCGASSADADVRGAHTHRRQRAVHRATWTANFLALDARNGKEPVSFNTGGPIAGGVVTYEQNGKQYVAVASGSSGGSIPLTGQHHDRDLRAVGFCQRAISYFFEDDELGQRASFVPGSSSTKPIYPSGTFWKTAVSFMIDLEHGHDGSIPAATAVDA